MLKEKPLLITFILVIILIIVGGVIAYRYQQKIIIQNRFDELSAIRKLKTKQIVDWHKERLGDAQAIRNNPLLLDELKSFVYSEDQTDSQEIVEWFDVLKSSYGYVDIILLDQNWKELIKIGSNIDVKEQKEHLNKYPPLLKSNNIVLTDIHLHRNSNPIYTIKISFDNEGTVFCYLLLNIDPNQFLYPLVQEWPTSSKTAESIIVRSEKDSVIILNELRHKKETALNFKIPLSEKSLPIVQAALGNSGLYRNKDYRGVDVLSSIGPIPGTNWFLICKIDEDEIFSAFQNALFISILAVFLLILITYFIFLNSWKSTKLKNLEKEIELKNKAVKATNLYATLSQINQTIVQEKNREEIIRKMTSIPIQYGNFKCCALNLFDDISDNLVVKSFYGEKEYFLEILDNNSSYTKDDIGSEAFNKSKTIVYNNTTQVEVDWAKIAVKYGIYSSAATPIKIADNTIGIFTLYSDQPNYFYHDEIKLIEEIALDIGFALDVIEKNLIKEQIEKKLIEHERQLSTLFSNLPGIAYRCKYDKQWTMELMSEGTINITGYTPEEFIEEQKISYNDLIHPDDRQFVWKTVETAVQAEKSFTMVYRITPKDSESVRWVWERGIAIYDENKEPIVLEGFVSDITDLKEARDQLKKSEESFKYLFMNNPLPKWIYDINNYEFIEVNDSALKKYGYSNDEFSKMTLFDIHPDREHKELNSFLKNERTKKTVSKEWKHKLKDGTIIDVLIISRAIEYKGKSAVLAVVVDITERVKAKDELVAAKEKAEEADKLKSDFLAQMSHEIRTPINVILSFHSLIKEEVYDKVSDDAKDSFRSIESASKRLIRTIDSILNMSQITRGSFNAVFSEFSVYDDLIVNLRNEFKSLIEQKRLNFNIKYECSPNTKIYGDHYTVLQLFNNLLDNALKYTEKGTITLSARCENDSVIIKIADTGIGISEDYLPHLFEAFSQEEHGYTRKFEGTGLGLALVKKYCELNRCTIDVESHKGKGTTFIVKFEKAKKN